MLIAYPVKTGLYLNLTNRCPCDCTFCLRNNGDGVYGSGSLWLEREPSVEEILAAIGAYSLSGYTEIVFCGFGEPTMRLETVLAVARELKARVPAMPLRLNTNGLSDLIRGARTAPLLAGLIDTVSVSLNTPDAEEYLALCRPAFGPGSWQAMIDFARDCVAHVPHVVLSIVDSPVTTPETQARCRRLAESIGARLRIRPFEAP